MREERAELRPRLRSLGRDVDNRRAWTLRLQRIEFFASAFNMDHCPESRGRTTPYLHGGTLTSRVVISCSF